MACSSKGGKVSVGEELQGSKLKKQTWREAIRPFYDRLTHSLLDLCTVGSQQKGNSVNKSILRTDSFHSGLEDGLKSKEAGTREVQ